MATQNPVIKNKRNSYKKFSHLINAYKDENKHLVFQANCNCFTVKQRLSKQQLQDFENLSEKEVAGMVWCYWFALKYGFEIDHIQPISKQGKHNLGNLQVVSKLYNKKKYNKADFISEADFYYEMFGNNEDIKKTVADRHNTLNELKTIILD